LLVLPSITPSDTPAPEIAQAFSPTPDITLEPTVSQTPVESLSPSPSATDAPSLTPTSSSTATIDASPTNTVVPSLTITDTPTRTPTETAIPTEEPGAILDLIELAMSATILPGAIETYGAPRFTPTGFVSTSSGLCLPPPGGFGTAYLQDATLSASLGCAVGASTSVPAAVQSFERGLMIYVGSPQPSIFVLVTTTGQFTRYDDTFNEALDPASGGNVPPAGLLEPIRGFGKVWRSQFGVRDALGWATASESGMTAVAQAFERGQMLALPNLGQIAVLSGSGSGSYRLVFGSS
jgi:hypothetical protein